MRKKVSKTMFIMHREGHCSSDLPRVQWEPKGVIAKQPCGDGDGKSGRTCFPKEVMPLFVDPYYQAGLLHEYGKQQYYLESRK